MGYFDEDGNSHSLMGDKLNRDNGGFQQTKTTNMDTESQIQDGNNVAFTFKQVAKFEALNRVPKETSDADNNRSLLSTDEIVANAEKIYQWIMK